MGPNGQDFTRFFCLIEHPQLNPGVRFIFLGVLKVRGCVIFTLQVLKGRLGVGVGFSPHLAKDSKLLRRLYYIAAGYHKHSHSGLRQQAAAASRCTRR